MPVTPNLGLELFKPLGVGWREDATAGALLDFNMMLIDAATASGGAVASVNGQVGVVVLTASSVGADASGAAAAAQTAAENFATNADTTVLSSAETFATSAVATETSRAETAEALLAPKASPTFTGTVSGITYTMVGADASGAAATAQSTSEAYAYALVSALVLPSTKAASSHEWLASYDASTGAFTQTQPAAADLSDSASSAGYVLRANGTSFVSAQLGYSDLSGTPTLAATTSRTSHSFFSSYNASTGAFGQKQPTVADLSDIPSANTVLAGPTSGAAATATFRVLVSDDIPNNAANTSGTASNLSGTPALPNGTTATTKNYTDNSGIVATTAFTQNCVNLSMATTPLSITGGNYSFSGLGISGLSNITASGGVITAVTWQAAGSGYKANDVVTIKAGNYDAMLRILTVNGSGQPLTGEILYGGTGYTTANGEGLDNSQLTAGFTFILTGTLISAVTFYVPNGSYLIQSNQWIVCNNTTGAYTVTVAVSNATNTGASGGRTVVIPQGTNNSRSVLIQSDGSLNVDLAGVVNYGDLSGTPALPNGTTATTQTALSADTKLATDAYCDLAVGVETTRALAAEALCLPLAGGTMTGILNITSGISLTWNADTSVSRISAGLLCIGTGASGNYAGSLQLANASLVTPVASSIVNSPTLTLSGVYESSSSPVTYTADSWTVQDVIGTGLNGASTLTFTHSGSTGAATVSVPLLKVTAANAGGFATGNAITFQDGQIIGPCYTNYLNLCAVAGGGIFFNTSVSATGGLVMYSGSGGANGTGFNLQCGTVGYPLVVSGNQTTAAGSCVILGNNSANLAATVGLQTLVAIQNFSNATFGNYASFAPTSGTASFNGLLINPIVNNTAALQQDNIKGLQQTTTVVTVGLGSVVAGTSAYTVGATVVLAAVTKTTWNGPQTVTALLPARSGTPYTVTNSVENSSSVVTLTIGTHSVVANDWVAISGVGTATWLNGQFVKVASVVANVSITFTDLTTHGTKTTGADNGSVSAGGSLTFTTTTGSYTGTADTGTVTMTPGSYSALNIAVVETSVPGVRNRLIDCYAGSAGTTPMFSVDNVGALYLASAAGAPTSAGTAGTAGQLIYYSGSAYLCTVTGVAGSATWNKLNMTSV